MIAVVIIPIRFPLPSGWSQQKVGEVQHGAWQVDLDHPIPAILACGSLTH